MKNKTKIKEYDLKKGRDGYRIVEKEIIMNDCGTVNTYGTNYTVNSIDLWLGFVKLRENIFNDKTTYKTFEIGSYYIVTIFSKFLLFSHSY